MSTCDASKPTRSCNKGPGLTVVSVLSDGAVAVYIIPPEGGLVKQRFYGKGEIFRLSWQAAILCNDINLLQKSRKDQANVCSLICSLGFKGKQITARVPPGGVGELSRVIVP